MLEANKILLKGLRNGDEKAYENIYNEYFENLVKYCFNLTNDLPQAQDIVQNVLIKIWFNRESIVITTSLKSYLYRAVFNAFLKEHDKRKRYERALIQHKQEVLDHLIDIDQEVLAKKMKLLDTAIEQLPKQCKRVFLLNKKRGYKYKEIASQLNLSEKTVEKHISRAIQRIKQKVGANITKILFLLFRKLPH